MAKRCGFVLLLAGSELRLTPFPVGFAEVCLGPFVAPQLRSNQSWISTLPCAFLTLEVQATGDIERLTISSISKLPPEDPTFANIGEWRQSVL